MGTEELIATFIKLLILMEIVFIGTLIFRAYTNWHFKKDVMGSLQRIEGLLTRKK